MIVVRFRVKCQPDKTEQVTAAYENVIAPSRAQEGVISFDIGRDVADPDSFIGTEVYDDMAALERNESLPEVAKAYRILEESLAAEPEATIFQVATSEPWGGSIE